VLCPKSISGFQPSGPGNACLIRRGQRPGKVRAFPVSWPHAKRSQRRSLTKRGHFRSNDVYRGDNWPQVDLYAQKMLTVQPVHPTWGGNGTSLSGPSEVPQAGRTGPADPFCYRRRKGATHCVVGVYRAHICGEFQAGLLGPVGRPISKRSPV
jgi:hypothetical protein